MRDELDETEQQRSQPVSPSFKLNSNSHGATTSGQSEGSESGSWREQALCSGLDAGRQERAVLLPMNTVLSAGAAPPLQGHSLFPNIFKYNKGHNDSINKSKQNKLKGTEQFTMKQFSQMHTLLIGNLWQFGIRVP